MKPKIATLFRRAVYQSEPRVFTSGPMQCDFHFVNDIQPGAMPTALRGHVDIRVAHPESSKGVVRDRTPNAS